MDCPRYGEVEVTCLSADMVEKRAEHLCLHGEYVGRVPLVEPVPHELLEERLRWCAKIQGDGAWSCDRRSCRRAYHGKVFIVVE